MRGGCEMHLDVDRKNLNFFHRGWVKIWKYYRFIFRKGNIDFTGEGTLQFYFKHCLPVLTPAWSLPILGRQHLAKMLEAPINQVTPLQFCSKHCPARLVQATLGKNVAFACTLSLNVTDNELPLSEKQSKEVNVLRWGWPTQPSKLLGWWGLGSW